MITSERRHELELERIADWLDKGILKYIGGIRINTKIDFHGEIRGYKYHGCRCKKCQFANALRQRK